MLVRVEVLVADVERAVKYIETAKSKKANTITHPILDLILAPPGLEHQFRYLHPPLPELGVPLEQRQIILPAERRPVYCGIQDIYPPSASLIPGSAG